MNEVQKKAISKICADCGNDPHRMMDIVIAVQGEFGHVSSEAMGLIAGLVGARRVDVESTISFYAFLSEEKKGKIVIRLCNDIIDKITGFQRIADTFRQELGIDFGETTEDDRFTLEHTPCIGMSDQAPAALINDVVVTKLTSDKARDICRSLKEYMDPHRLVKEYGDGNNAHKLVESMVQNNIRLRGPVIFADFDAGEGLGNALAMHPKEVIREIKAARLRGRGGAGFPTGMKWEFTRNAEGTPKYIFCNADEGEPGTFKDRVLLTEKADMVLEGMTIAGYAIGASEGIIYLRGEYTYLKSFLQKAIDDRQSRKLLGNDVYGKKGFNFNIRIQMGAGAYVCGEETALISSAEGFRGDPKNRPPFPAQKGYLGHPTLVNNVETYCAAAKIMEKGAGWFNQRGTEESTGTKLLSISGDCELPGVYEVPYGMKVSEVLRLVGAFETTFVNIGGPSGAIIGPDEFDRRICFSDMPTGGSMMVFDKRRSLLEVVHNFTEFFIEETCGYCTPCRVGNTLLMERLERIIEGLGVEGDLEYIEQLANSIKKASRCGLGQTSPNPILFSIKNFRGEYEQRLREDHGGTVPTFDLEREVSAARAVAKG